MDAATQPPRTGNDTGDDRTAGRGTPGGLGRAIESVRALGTVRLAALAFTGLLTLGLIGFLTFRTATTPMGLLYGDLDQRDAAQIVAALERARVPYRLGRNGTEVLAPEEDIPRLRLSLARDGLPAGGSVGYEIFDRQNGLTTTPFQQDINRLRALEGEIARSIRGLDGVASARVHLVLPRREPFSRDRGESQASVVLQMRGIHRLDREGVQAVLHLVAAAVPGLKPTNIAVVDGRGELLSRGGQAGANGLAQSQEEIRRGQEMRMARSVEEMLERILGPGRVRAEATIEMDHDRVQTTEERFDPENQVPRSQSSVNESSRNGEQQNVSVANQLPGAPPAQQSSGPQSQEARQEETVNYEIGRTTRNTLRDQPVVRRLSVAVLVDGVWEPGENGGPARFRERTTQEMERISALVRGAIGFNESRGDRLEVVSLRFADPAWGSDGEGQRGPLGLPPLTPTLTARLLESALYALVALLAVFFVGRPVAKRLVAGMSPRPVGALAGAGAAGGALPPPEGALPGMPGVAGGAAAGAAAALSGEAGEAGAPADQAMIDLAMVSGQISVSSLNSLTDLVEKYPEETLAVVRRWLSPEEAAKS
ncbi:flagellar basal-body MS-ring/collar protein FliF [Pseudoroseomonas cervicalis]|uniref:flagellar basal-body MS-ring/collar protein FliF n=1 Tax=Teichococcus cervicalis TaxID=204525 RepID=UPI0022F1A471|nr:flagellar basal-body MS-ring/collar protein FliF [Pseudoroseomonas cervicalis]WBV44555.1 flagellar basal-body MS-ring/collar protein FliF [Pseudoroseomonas cervicalis]